MRPGSAPLEALAISLERLLGDSTELTPAEAVARRTATLRRGPLGLIKAVAEARLPADDRVLVVVDQLEELFRFLFTREDGEDDTRAFVQLLLEAVRQREQPIYVVLTIRSDFVGECTAVPGLAQLVNQSPYLVPNLARQGLREIIERPAETHQASISKRLVNRILLDVGEDPLRLPVMQHALMRTWEAWQRKGGSEPIDEADYQQAGGLAYALSLHADAAWAPLDRDGQRMAQTIFCALTDLNNGRPIRRPARVRELAALCRATPEAVVRVLDVFRAQDALFLMPPLSVPLEPDTIVDITHESLIHSWQRMSEWMALEAQRAALYRRLVSDAQRWQDGEMSLWRNPQLALGRQLLSDAGVSAQWAERYGGSFDLAVRYLQASAEDEASALAHERAHVREPRHSKTVIGLAFLTGMILATVIAFLSR
jgi:hypothetical protein